MSTKSLTCFIRYDNVRVNHHFTILVNCYVAVMIHAHIVVTDEAGQAFGGHLMKGSIVSATAELVIVEGLDAHLVRTLDSKTNLNLLKLG